MSSGKTTAAEHESPYLVDDEEYLEESDYESGSEYETDEDKDCQEDEAVEAGTDDNDDGMLLLLQARRRMLEQQEKNMISQKDCGDDDSSDDECEEKEESSVEGLDVHEEGIDLIQETHQRLSMNGGSKTDNIYIRSPSRSPASSTPNRSPSRSGRNSLGLLPQSENNENNMTSLRRRQRDENAELWKLLRHSQNRVAETKSLVEKVENSEEFESASKESNLDNSCEDGSATSRNMNSSFQMEDEKKCEDDVERNFEQENRELFELLQQSKHRLEEAARKKVEDAEKEAAADELKGCAKINPYKDIKNLPDVPEDKCSAGDLTQKELLIAMAVAEEAARSGRGEFVTPSKDVLRTRDLSSFDFLNEETNVSTPQTPAEIGLRQEQNQFRTLYKTLSTRWKEFKERAREIDCENNYQIAMQRAAAMRRSSRMLLNGILPTKQLQN